MSLLARFPMKVKGSWMCHAGVTQSRLHSRVLCDLRLFASSWHQHLSAYGVARFRTSKPIETKNLLYLVGRRRRIDGGLYRRRRILLRIVLARGAIPNEIGGKHGPTCSRGYPGPQTMPEYRLNITTHQPQSKMKFNEIRNSLALARDYGVCHVPGPLASDKAWTDRSEADVRQQDIETAGIAPTQVVFRVTNWSAEPCTTKEQV
jgi:hypothetical protein